MEKQLKNTEKPVLFYIQRFTIDRGQDLVLKIAKNKSAEVKYNETQIRKIHIHEATTDESKYKSVCISVAEQIHQIR